MRENLRLGCRREKRQKLDVIAVLSARILIVQKGAIAGNPANAVQDPALIEEFAGIAASSQKMETPQ